MPGGTIFFLKAQNSIIRGLKITETTTHKIRLSPYVEKACDEIQHPLMVHLTKSNTYSWYKLSTTQG